MEIKWLFSILSGEKQQRLQQSLWLISSPTQFAAMFTVISPAWRPLRSCQVLAWVEIAMIPPLLPHMEQQELRLVLTGHLTHCVALYRSWTVEDQLTRLFKHELTILPQSSPKTQAWFLKCTFQKDGCDPQTPVNPSEVNDTLLFLYWASNHFRADIVLRQ